jgi:hypothetical protein
MSDVAKNVAAGQLFRRVAQDRALTTPFACNDVRTFLQVAYWRVKRDGWSNPAQVAVGMLDVAIERSIAEGSLALSDPEAVPVTIRG